MCEHLQGTLQSLSNFERYATTCEKFPKVRTVVKNKRFVTYLREFQKFMSYPAALTKGGQNTSRALCRNDLRPHRALAGMQVLFAKVRYNMYEILKGTLQNV